MDNIFVIWINIKLFVTLSKFKVYSRSMLNLFNLVNEEKSKKDTKGKFKLAEASLRDFRKEAVS